MRLSDADLDRIQAYCELVADGVYMSNDRKGLRTVEFAREAAADLPRLVAAYRELRELAEAVFDYSGCNRFDTKALDRLELYLERRTA